MSHSSIYLDMLDQTLRAGLQGLSQRFVDAQVDFVARCQQPDGGFRGRQGDSDLYYTDFALRCLVLLAPGHSAFDRAAEYFDPHSNCPRNVVDCFNILNVQRILGPRVELVDQSGLLKTLHEHTISKGGLTRTAENTHASAYHTFLAALCFQMLGEAVPNVDGAIHAVESLGRSDGGYAEIDGQAESQTSATAAAVGFLMLHDALAPKRAADAMRFLAEMQSHDGGLRAHAAVRAGDLLSTFTGLVTLAALDGLQEIDFSEVARFLRSVAQPGGGFLSGMGDETADVEYAYYGLGVLAQLRLLTPPEQEPIVLPRGV